MQTQLIGAGEKKKQRVRPLTDAQPTSYSSDDDVISDSDSTSSSLRRWAGIRRKRPVSPQSSGSTTQPLPSATDSDDDSSGTIEDDVDATVEMSDNEAASEGWVVDAQVKDELYAAEIAAANGRGRLGVLRIARQVREMFRSHGSVPVDVHVVSGRLMAAPNQEAPSTFVQLGVASAVLDATTLVVDFSGDVPTLSVTLRIVSLGEAGEVEYTRVDSLLGFSDSLRLDADLAVETVFEDVPAIPSDNAGDNDFDDSGEDDGDARGPLDFNAAQRQVLADLSERRVHLMLSSTQSDPVVYVRL